MTASWKDRVSFVMVEPMDPENIGAAARAIKNMGFTRLGLVNPRTEITEMSYHIAHNATDILDGVAMYDTLSDAVEGASLVIGTTRRKGRDRGMALSMEAGSDRVSAAAMEGSDVAVLFGTERRGLYNEHTDLCAYLITIPTDSAQPSINLAMSILLIAYELHKSGLRARPKAEPRPRAPRRSVFHDQDEAYQRALEILDLVGYTKDGDREIGRSVTSAIRHVLGRAGITERELRIFHGICTRILVRLKGGRQ